MYTRTAIAVRSLPRDCQGAAQGVIRCDVIGSLLGGGASKSVGRGASKSVGLSKSAGGGASKSSLWGRPDKYSPLRTNQLMCLYGISNV